MVHCFIGIAAVYFCQGIGISLTGFCCAQDLKFGIGDGRLRYYLYNWRVAHSLESTDVGLILL